MPRRLVDPAGVSRELRKFSAPVSACPVRAVLTDSKKRHSKDALSARAVLSPAPPLDGGGVVAGAGVGRCARRHIRPGHQQQVQCARGKGRKQRCVPLTPATSTVLRARIRKRYGHPDEPAFPPIPVVGSATTVSTSASTSANTLPGNNIRHRRRVSGDLDRLGNSLEGIAMSITTKTGALDWSQRRVKFRPRPRIPVPRTRTRWASTPPAPWSPSITTCAPNWRSCNWR